jgi:hypothetical protein
LYVSGGSRSKSRIEARNGNVSLFLKEKKFELLETMSTYGKIGENRQKFPSLSNACRNHCDE